MQKKKKTGRPKMILRIFDPRDDRTGGYDYEDLEGDIEQNSPSTDKDNHSSNPKEQKSV